MYLCTHLSSCESVKIMYVRTSAYKYLKDYIYLNVCNYEFISVCMCACGGALEIARFMERSIDRQREGRRVR